MKRRVVTSRIFPRLTYLYWNRTIKGRLLRWWPLILLTLGFWLLVLFGRGNQHINSAVLLVQNRYYNQLFKRAPALEGDLDNVSVVLFWTPFFSNAFFYVGYGAKPFAHCPVNACVATNDRQYLSRSHALLFHNQDTSHWDLPDIRAPEQLYVFFSMEAPRQSPHMLGPLNEAFNLTMTYRTDSDVRVQYGRTRVIDAPGSGGGDGDGQSADLAARVARGEAQPPDQPFVAWVVSNCDTPSERESFVDELRKYIAVDQYGGCNGVPPPGATPPSCYRNLARTHLFYLAFENSLCRDYVTEKFFLSLRAGMIPVVRGAAPSEYLAMAPPHSYIHVEDFVGPQQLARHLGAVAGNASALSELTAWRRRYGIDGVQPAWCELCDRLRGGDPAGGSVVPDLGKWWYQGSGCRRPETAYES